jgi:asparagine synthase (glutamine-hydrolysing)
VSLGYRRLLPGSGDFLKHAGPLRDMLRRAKRFNEATDMCGLAGIFDSRGGSEVDRALLARMTDSLVHRGPDDSGYHLAPGLGLGHRRLSIIDLHGGRQPLFNEDRSVVVVYNGEIYNYRELAAELARRGHVFRTESDTEVIVHGWEEWGPDCVEKFRGMFAFALWDQGQETLFLARDRLGIKPLYHAALADGRLIFGSELKALLRHPGVTREIDPEAVEDYFAYGYVPDPKTIYRGVAKLAPGTCLTWRRGKAHPDLRTYWEPRFERRAVTNTTEAGEQLVDLLRQSVELRMVADVPLGAFLSGGVDSSAVVALMAGLSDQPVRTCAIGFDRQDYDETDYAAEVAAACGSDHHVGQVAADAYDLVDRMAELYDEPFADSSAIPTYRLSGLARERVTVALSGDGGDEVFAGYRRYRWHHYEELVRGRLPAGLRGALFGSLGRLYPKLDWAPKPLRAKTTFQALARDSVGGYFHSVAVVPDGLRQGLYSPAMSRRLRGYHAQEVVRRHMAEAAGAHHLDRVQLTDLRTYLPGDILTKVDRASMAHSLEVRVPFLDHKLVEWAAGLPPDLRLRRGEGKYILKQAMESRLPRRVLERQKMGFSVPLAHWFRGPLRHEVRASLTGARLRETEIFDMTAVTRLLDQHHTGARDHSAALWALVMFEAFLRKVHVAPHRALDSGAPQDALAL